MIDPEAANVVTAWVEAAQRGDVDALLLLSSDGVAKSVWDQAGEPASTAPQRIALGLQRRYAEVDLTPAGFASEVRRRDPI